VQPAVTDPVVELHGVRYVAPRGQTPVLDQLTFTVARGECLVLLGESGCGKTTTLKLINRILEPSEGEVRVEGKDVSRWDVVTLRRNTGYVLQESGLFPHFTVARNVGLVPTLQGWNRDRVKERVDQLLELVGLDPPAYAERYPDELSGGQRQRVGVARALAADPPLLLLDEPFGALDPLTRAALRRDFAALRLRLGKTAVLVTHDLADALELGTRIGLLRGGKLVVCEPPEAFLRSTDPYARAYCEALGVHRVGNSLSGCP
jgi:osmoprotectant transport system ATP-binding protein